MLYKKKFLTKSRIKKYYKKQCYKKITDPGIQGFLCGDVCLRGWWDALVTDIVCRPCRVLLLLVQAHFVKAMDEENNDV